MYICPDDHVWHRSPVIGSRIFSILLKDFIARIKSRKKSSQRFTFIYIQDIHKKGFGELVRLEFRFEFQKPAFIESPIVRTVGRSKRHVKFARNAVVILYKAAEGFN